MSSIYIPFDQFSELQEAVLIPSKKLITQVLETLKQFRIYMVGHNLDLLKDDTKICKTLTNFLDNNKIENIEFVFDPKKGKIGDKRWDKLHLITATCSISTIKIYIGKGFWENFFNFTDVNFKKFLELLTEVLEHELVHELQNKTIAKKSGPHQGIVYYRDEKDDEEQATARYLGDEHEIMAHAREASIQLLKQFGKKNALKILRAPRKFSSYSPRESTLYVYMSYFDLESKVYKRFIKYIVEYIEKTN